MIYLGLIASFILGRVVGATRIRLRVLQTRGEYEALFDHLIRVAKTLPEPERSRFFRTLSGPIGPVEDLGVIVNRIAP